MNQKNLQHQDQNIRQYTSQYSDILIPKNVLTPILHRIQLNKPRSLYPMIALPNFNGNIPINQQIDLNKDKNKNEKFGELSWIGNAFSNIIYKKYCQTSYQKIDNIQQNWNLWLYDISKLILDKHTIPEQSPSISNKNQINNDLLFQSRFQSGNLSLVSKVSDHQYNLLLQNDINTSGYAKWFFFKVSNIKKDLKIKFNILNLSGSNNLYSEGMKIMTYSMQQSLEKNISWHRSGESISYTQNNYRKGPLSNKKFWTLSWSYTFEYCNDQVYFAYNYPFTFTNLTNLLQKLEADVCSRQIMTRSLLCNSLNKNRVQLITITQNHPDQEELKPYIVICARVHPGQTVSSFVMNGIIKFLLSSNEKAKKLRQNFIFKLIPMLNPDGVIHGNYRANLSGCDLNKKWQNPSKSYHPQIYYLKKLILKYHQENQISMYCDLHGHSFKKNAFIYGCHDDNHPFQSRQFPFFMSKLFKGFEYSNCSFIDQNNKQDSPRSILTKELNISNIFSLQTSFCGPSYEDIHFSVQNYQELGQKFCQALVIYSASYIKQKYLTAAIKQKFNFQYDHSHDLQKRRMYLQELHLQKSDTAKLNSQDSQGEDSDRQSQNIIEQKVMKKFILLQSISTSEKRYNSNENDLKKKSKLVIYKSMSREKFLNKQQKERQRYIKIPKDIDLRIERIQKREIATSQQYRKKKEEKKVKIEIVQKTQINKCDINEFLKKKSQSPVKFLKRIKCSSETSVKKNLNLEQQSIFTKLKLNNKFQLIAQNSTKKSSIFKNSCLNNIEIPIRQKISSKQIQKKLQFLKLQIKDGEKQSINRKKTHEDQFNQKQLLGKYKYSLNNFLQSTLTIKKSERTNGLKSVLSLIKRNK